MRSPIVEGTIFFRLTVIEFLGTIRRKRRYLCRCIDGNERVVSDQDLRAGHVMSCGCYRKERQAIGMRHTHRQSGAKRTPIYRAWEAMWTRTTSIELYQRREITVDSVWNDFEPFKAYIDEKLGPRPRNYSLDRIDNDRGYEPGNVRWASSKRQARNRSDNTNITVNGVTRCIAEWAEVNNLTSIVICARRARGWSDEKAVTTPRQKYTRHNDPNAPKGDD